MSALLQVLDQALQPVSRQAAQINGSASTLPESNPASCAEVVQTATGSSDLSKTQAKELVKTPTVLHCYLLLAAQRG